MISIILGTILVVAPHELNLTYVGIYIGVMGAYRVVKAAHDWGTK